MERNHPLLIEDAEHLRKKIRALENQASKPADIWNMMKRCARNSPMSFPWFTPFVALITQEPADIANAKQVLASYLSKLEPMYFGSGIQMHFWCFSFPHAKWCLYFQWLCCLGAYTQEEEREIAETLVSYQFLNFYYGVNTKPEPECVDNQTLSLALSCAVVGYLFSDICGEPCEMARIMYRDGLRRLPILLGSLPKSGYTGEGSTYMDCVVGPAIPITIEMLQLFTGEKGLLFKPFAPNGTIPMQVLEMVAREWMPGGLLLPWDNYGYQFGTRSAIAYAANRTGRADFYDILEKDSNLSYDIGIGWAYDDFVWSLVWWPETRPASAAGDSQWFDPEVGACLRSEDDERCLVQIWDDSAPNMPARCHVNPGMVLFNAYKIPLSADGSSLEGGGKRFYFEDTWREVGFLTIGQKDRYNYGNGCGGAHSVLLVDHWEGMRTFKEGPQIVSCSADLTMKTVESDTTPMYQEKWPDIHSVRRKSALLQDRFFTVEEWADCEKPHCFTSRFVLRPDLVSTPFGVKIETPEGVTLHLFDALDPHSSIHLEIVDGHPKKPDGCCVLADFDANGTEAHRLYAAFPSRTRRLEKYESDFACFADPERKLDFAAVQSNAQPDAYVPLHLPAYMEADLPVQRFWWYKKRLAKRPGSAWVSLPGGMINARLWLSGIEMPLPDYSPYTMLMQPQVRIPKEFEVSDFVDMVLYTEVPASHYEGDINGASVGLWGGVALCYPCDEEQMLSCNYDGSVLILRTTQGEYRADYQMMKRLQTPEK